VKGLWDKAPVSWPAEVPFMDPNNRKRTKTEGGGKKPTKQEILPMLIHLFRSCKVTRVCDCSNVYVSLFHWSALEPGRVKMLDLKLMLTGSDAVQLC